MPCHTARLINSFTRVFVPDAFSIDDWACLGALVSPFSQYLGDSVLEHGDDDGYAKWQQGAYRQNTGSVGDYVANRLKISRGHIIPHLAMSVRTVGDL